MCLLKQFIIYEACTNPGTCKQKTEENKLDGNCPGYCKDYFFATVKGEFCSNGACSLCRNLRKCVQELESGVFKPLRDREGKSLNDEANINYKDFKDHINEKLKQHGLMQ